MGYPERLCHSICCILKYLWHCYNTCITFLVMTLLYTSHFQSDNTITHVMFFFFPEWWCYIWSAIYTTITAVKLVRVWASLATWHCVITALSSLSLHHQSSTGSSTGQLTACVMSGLSHIIIIIAVIFFTAKVWIKNISCIEKLLAIKKKVLSLILYLLYSFIIYIYFFLLLLQKTMQTVTKL